MNVCEVMGNDNVKTRAGGHWGLRCECAAAPPSSREAGRCWDGAIGGLRRRPTAVKWDVGQSLSVVRPVLWAFVLSWLWLPSYSQAASIPVEHFSKRPDFLTLKVSPSGSHIAATVPLSDRTVLTVKRVQDWKVTASFSFGAGSHVLDFDWASDSRLVFTRGTRRGSLAVALSHGDLYAGNADGSNLRAIFGYTVRHGIQETRLKAPRATWAWGEVVDPLYDDPKHVLVSAISWDGPRRRQKSVLYRVNIHSGAKTRLTRAPESEARVLADNEGVPRFAVAPDVQANLRVWYREDDVSPWKVMGTTWKSHGFDPIPLAFSNDNTRVYVTGVTDFSTVGLFEYNLRTATRRLLYAHPDVDVSTWTFSRGDGGTVMRVGIEPDRFSWVYLDNESDTAKKLQIADATFPNDVVDITSATREGRYAVLNVKSDRNPGDFYLFDLKKKGARYLASARPWIDPTAMAAKRPVTVTSRDGVKLRGYITLPLGVPPRKLPMVVVPHGGPHGVRVLWNFETDVQLLAHHGFAVLQINYRGSDGYGAKFLGAGEGRWGTTIQNDITDATRWAVAQGWVDSQRICIYGASFGAYAAAMGVILHPELYRCAVGLAGVYDLQMLFEVGDVTDKHYGLAYLRRVVGDDPQRAKRWSPTSIKNIARIQAPIFLAHGGQDRRAPVVQAEAFRDALQRGSKSFEWMLKPEEGHGFNDDANRREFYERLLTFVTQHTSLPKVDASVP